MTIYHKYRPATFGDIAGQDHITRTLTNSLRNDRVVHAYLFCGPRGTGKTSAARVLAKAVNCTNLQDGEPCNQCDSCQTIDAKRSMDIMEIDAASNRGIDDIRSLKDKTMLYPSSGARKKVYIIDEAHMLTDQASNALLKTLEEPPEHVMFILATTEPHKMISTIRSRCQEHTFRRISQAAIMGKLISICNTDGITIDPLGLRLVAKHVEGSMRDAEMILDQLTASGEEITIEQINDLLGAPDHSQIDTLVDHILAGQAAQALEIVLRVSKEGGDLQKFAEGVTERLRDLLLVKVGAGAVLDVSQDAIDEMKVRVDGIDRTTILRAARSFESAQFGVQGQKSLPLELALVESLSSDS